MNAPAFRPGDRVIIMRECRGDKRARVTVRGQGVVVAVYPKFLLVDLGKWRECFWPEELKKVSAGRAAA